MRRFGGGPSERTRISSAGGFLGEQLPEMPALEVGVGYRLAASMSGCSGEGGEGDWERTERGEDGGEEGGSEGERDEDGGGSIRAAACRQGSRDGEEAAIEKGEGTVDKERCDASARVVISWLEESVGLQWVCFGEYARPRPRA